MSIPAQPQETCERYVDRRELAKIMGIGVSSVDRLVAEGMPSQTWGLKRTRRYLPSEAMAWAAARGRASE